MHIKLYSPFGVLEIKREIKQLFNFNRSSYKRVVQSLFAMNDKQMALVWNCIVDAYNKNPKYAHEHLPGGTLTFKHFLIGLYFAGSYPSEDHAHAVIKVDQKTYRKWHHIVKNLLFQYLPNAFFLT